MTFVTPLLLAGTALVALPIVLHLIMRRKPRQFEFPALRLVRSRHETNQRRLRLRHLLLLLLRAAAIALLAIALARPSLKWSAVSQESPVAAALIFDNSVRMEYRHENQTRLEAAGRLGLWLLKQLPRESQIAVLDAKAAPAVFQVDRGAARQRIERLSSVTHAEPLPHVIDRALELLEKSDLTVREVYLFTDLARIAWPSDLAPRLQERAARLSGVRFYVIDVGVAKPTDFALGELSLSGQVLSNRSPLHLQTVLERLGPGGQRIVDLYLLDAQGKPRKRDQQTREIESDGSAAVEFLVGSLPVGTHQGYARIVGQDALAADDTRYFTVEVKPAWEILVVAPKPAEQRALFLTEALAPSAFRRSGQARFDCKIVPLEALSRQSLENFAAVCLADPRPLEPDLWQKLADYVADGHGLAIFLGREATPLEAFNEGPAQELLPGKLLRQARRPGGELALVPRDLEHPVLLAFRDVSGTVPWGAFPVYRYWELGPLASGAKTIISYTDGRPALVERPLGKGRVVTMTTPVSDRPDESAWNLLPVGQSWPFVILVNQTMLYLVGSSEQRLNYYAGQTVVVSLDEEARRQSYVLTTPEEVKFTLSADPKQDALVISSTGAVGNYRVQAGGATGVDRGFSVNLAPSQTDLTRMTEEELQSMFGPIPFSVARDRTQIDRDVSQGRVGRELFPLLIILLVLVLAAEQVVANRFYRE